MIWFRQKNMYVNFLSNNFFFCIYIESQLTCWPLRQILAEKYFFFCVFIRKKYTNKRPYTYITVTTTYFVSTLAFIHDEKRGYVTENEVILVAVVCMWLRNISCILFFSCMNGNGWNFLSLFLHECIWNFSLTWVLVTLAVFLAKNPTLPIKLIFSCDLNLIWLQILLKFALEHFFNLFLWKKSKIFFWKHFHFIFVY